MLALRRGVRAAAARRREADLLLEAVQGEVARCAAEAEGGRERPGPGGAGGPFPDAGESDDELILEDLAERIAREVEARPPACLWCVKTLTNGSAFCSDVCREDYHKKLMPRPQRGGDPAIVQRIGKRQRDQELAAAWRAEHGVEL